MKQRTTDLFLAGFLVLAFGVTSGCIEAEHKIVIEDYNISIRDVGVDKIYIDSIDVILRNEGNAPVKIDKVIFSSGKSKIEDTFYGSLNTGEQKKKKLHISTFTSFEKEIGIEHLNGTIIVIDSSKNVIAEKNITIPLSIVRVGDTIPEIGYKHNLSLTLLSWKESDIAVNGPYTDGYYTFTAKPSMKFIILTFKFQNNWIRVQETPYLNAGEIATNKGYIYNIWDPLGGVHSEEYEPRKATDMEIRTLIGDSGAYEDLLPEKSIKGCVVFEIPENETPIEASIVYVPSLIKYEQ